MHSVGRENTILYNYIYVTQYRSLALGSVHFRDVKKPNCSFLAYSLISTHISVKNVFSFRYTKIGTVILMHMLRIRGTVCLLFLGVYIFYVHV